MGSSFWFDTINLEWDIVYIEGSQIILYEKNVFLSLKIVFVGPTVGFLMLWYSVLFTFKSLSLLYLLFIS